MLSISISTAPPEDGGGIEMISWPRRSEEHTSELQSLAYLVCRLLLEKKKKKKKKHIHKNTKEKNKKGQDIDEDINATNKITSTNKLHTTSHSNQSNTNAILITTRIAT